MHENLTTSITLDDSSHNVVSTPPFNGTCPKPIKLPPLSHCNEEYKVEH